MSRIDKINKILDGIFLGEPPEFKDQEMSKDRVKFSDAGILEIKNASNHMGKQFYRFHIPKDKFESREFICDLVGHSVVSLNGEYECSRCRLEGGSDYFRDHMKETCEVNGHTAKVTSDGLCYTCFDAAEATPKTKQPTQPLAAKIKEVRDRLDEIEALIREGGE